MALPKSGDQPWADALNGYITDLKNEADTTKADVAGHKSASDPHNVLPSASADAAAKISAHAAASDPHGDRANTTAQIAAHAGSTDPHGDRAFTVTQVNTHVNAKDPHGDRAYAASILNLPGAVYAFLSTGASISTVSTWVNLTNSLSATVTVPSSGNLRISFGFVGYNRNTSGSYVRLAPVLSGANVLAAIPDNSCFTGGDGDTSASRQILLTGLNPGLTTVKLQGYISSGTSSDNNVFDQWMYLEPMH